MPSRLKRNSCSPKSSSSIDSPPSDSNGRQQRNQAEKKRRDKLNNFIGELAALVPLVQNAAKRPDKTGILRLSAAFLRLHYSSLNPTNGLKKETWWPQILPEDHFSDLLHMIEGFFLLTSPTGKILYSSKSVEEYLGHHDVEMIGYPITDFIHPTDVERVKEELKTMSFFSTRPKRNGEQPHVRSSFCVRVRERSQPRTEIITYQTMHFSCCLSSNEGVIKTFKRPADGIGTDKNTASDCSYGGLLKIHVKPMKINLLDELTITEAFQEEYITRHGPNGQILFADHRISTVTGHLPHEVMGMLAYDYINPLDVPVAQFAQKLMFSSSNGTGMIVYRLKTRNEMMIYLKSIGHLQYDGSSTKISHFICVNKLLSQEEGEEELKRFRERYSPRINEYLALLHSRKSCTVKSPKINETMNNPSGQDISTLPAPSAVHSSKYHHSYQPFNSTLKNPVMSQDANSRLQPSPSFVQSPDVQIEAICHAPPTASKSSLDMSPVSHPKSIWDNKNDMSNQNEFRKMNNNCSMLLDHFSNFRNGCSHLLQYNGFPSIPHASCRKRFAEVLTDEHSTDFQYNVKNNAKMMRCSSDEPYEEIIDSGKSDPSLIFQDDIFFENSRKKNETETFEPYLSLSSKNNSNIPLLNQMPFSEQLFDNGVPCSTTGNPISPAPARTSNGDHNQSNCCSYYESGHNDCQILRSQTENLDFIGCDDGSRDFNSHPFPSDSMGNSKWLKGYQ